MSLRIGALVLYKLRIPSESTKKICGVDVKNPVLGNVIHMKFDLYYQLYGVNIPPDLLVK
jgi:hypothetical protein